MIIGNSIINKGVVPGDEALSLFFKTLNNEYNLKTVDKIEIIDNNDKTNTSKMIVSFTSENNTKHIATINYARISIKIVDVLINCDDNTWFKVENLDV